MIEYGLRRIGLPDLSAPAIAAAIYSFYRGKSLIQAAVETGAQVLALESALRDALTPLGSLLYDAGCRRILASDVRERAEHLNRLRLELMLKNHNEDEGTAPPSAAKPSV